MGAFAILTAEANVLGCVFYTRALFVNLCRCVSARYSQSMSLTWERADQGGKLHCTGPDVLPNGYIVAI